MALDIAAMNQLQTLGEYVLSQWEKGVPASAEPYNRTLAKVLQPDQMKALRILLGEDT